MLPSEWVESVVESQADRDWSGLRVERQRDLWDVVADGDPHLLAVDVLTGTTVRWLRFEFLSRALAVIEPLPESSSAATPVQRARTIAGSTLPAAERRAALLALLRGALEPGDRQQIQDLVAGL